MTVTDAARESVTSGLEQDKKDGHLSVSHLNPPPSYDLADHPAPTGREEIWRFTPLKRLRGILDGEASDATLTWDTTLPDGVTLTTISQAEARDVRHEEGSRNGTNGRFHEGLLQKHSLELHGSFVYSVLCSFRHSSFITI